ncbi:LysR family transcriptional regulator ArgP [Streptantibioticus silvisoli]|uniref:LysR family transcriptional regulator ArgP n=1 Tax=Streptantibioticus silvisoli TaxID=2705255 RepID=A0ABT6W8X1_9ACTN|nr:LysR family transcriptional regulator ArgP [Streptantibioticus silvisoli]MDI5967104.1 LysR family transcriptional regulator ArgP [Streptantibioticus silvisoli]
MTTELPLDQVRTLLAAVDEGTFDAAATVLHVTPSAVSQRIKALEQRVGRVLLQRTKPLRLTDSGRTVARFARQLAWLERDTLAELGMTPAGEPSRVTIAVNADSLATWFLPALGRVPQDARICFELRREDQDHTTALLREGLVMAAVTSSPDPVAGCSVRRLGRMRYRAAAAPAFVARWLAGWPATPLGELLTGVPVVVWDRRDRLQDAFADAVTGGTGAGTLRHHVPTSEGFLDAVAAGLGWGMVPQAQAAGRLERGELVDLAPDRPVDVPLYWQQWRLDSPTLTAAARAVAEQAATTLDDG